MENKSWRNYAPSVALAILIVAGLATQAGSPPDVPCDGVWISKTVTVKDGCDNDREEMEWVCVGGIRPRLLPPLSFEPNQGQAAPGFDFVVKTASLGVLLDDGDALLQVPGPSGRHAGLRLHLAGARRAQGEGVSPLPGVTHYLTGRDPSRWRTNVPTFARVRYRDVYPGIDVVYYGTEGQLEHDFIVQPGVDPAQIRMDLEGASRIELQADGSAVALVDNLRVFWRKPVLYQMRYGQRQPVEGAYRLEAGANRLSFTVGAYDRNADLIIDPVIAYVSYFGRSAAEGGSRMAVDSAGNAYITGITFDAFFPVTPGAPFVSKGTHGDIVVTKFNPSGTEVLYTTHLGGANGEGGLGIALDRDGNIYLAGSTDSDDYPVSANAFDRFLQPPGAPSDPMDCVVTKLNAAGNAILYSTHLGGTGVDACVSIAVDAQGAAYVAGRTASTNFPVSDSAPQRISRGIFEGFIAKLNPAGTALVYATLFGGVGADGAAAIAIDGQGAAYVTGHTRSSFGFPVTPGAPQSRWGGTVRDQGAGDAFVLKLDPAGQQWVYGTYLGGSRDDMGLGIAVDAQGNAYVTGQTTSPNFAVTERAYQREFRGAGGHNYFPGGDAFVVKVNPAGTGFVYSTLLGGTRDDWGTGIVADAAGNAYVGGATLSTNFPVSQDAYQRTFGGTAATDPFPTGDAFLAQLNPEGSALVYGSYLGGSADEMALGIALDRFGAVYLSGSTLSSNLPVTAGAPQTRYGGASGQVAPLGDLFVARFGTPIPDASVPAIRGFGSAANNAAGGVAPGEWIIINGANLGPATRVDVKAAEDGSIPAAALAGTRVLFDDLVAPIFFTSAGAVQVAVPFGVAGKANVQLIVEYNNRRSSPLTVPVVAAKPALFTINGAGNGPGLIVNLADGTVNAADNPARIGSTVALALTGAGVTDPASADGKLTPGEGAPVLALPVKATVGGVEAEVKFSRGAPGSLAGLARVEIVVPEGLEPGEHEVLVTVGEVRSQSGVTMAVQMKAETAPPEPAPEN